MPYPIVSTVDFEQVSADGVVLVYIASIIGQSLLLRFPFIEKDKKVDLGACQIAMTELFNWKPLTIFAISTISDV